MIVLIAAGSLFLFFAYRSWQDAATDQEGGSSGKAVTGASLTSYSMIFVAELGDKTQLAMIALVASKGSVLSVFVGGTLSLWMVSLQGAVLTMTGTGLLSYMRPRHFATRRLIRCASTPNSASVGAWMR